MTYSNSNNCGLIHRTCPLIVQCGSLMWLVFYASLNNNGGLWHKVMHSYQAFAPTMHAVESVNYSASTGFIENMISKM